MQPRALITTALCVFAAVFLGVAFIAITQSPTDLNPIAGPTRTNLFQCYADSLLVEEHDDVLNARLSNNTAVWVLVYPSGHHTYYLQQPGENCTLRTRN